jgi:hypothetical protein
MPGERIVQQLHALCVASARQYGNAGDHVTGPRQVLCDAVRLQD